MSPSCPNCLRFVEALSRTPAAATVQAVDVAVLARTNPGALQRVSAVPTLLMADGRVLVGTEAFEWLKPHEAGMAVDAFEAGDALGFSLVDDPLSRATFAPGYSSFS